MDIEAELKKVITVLSKFKKTAYLPKVKETEKTFSSNSKIGGYPYLRNENDWTVCPNCKNHMQLFLQLNLEDLPVKKDKGLVQLFYCTNTVKHCEVEHEAFFPFSKAVECRKISIDGKSSEIKPIIEDLFNEKTIIDFTPIDDYPHVEEYEELGIDLELGDDVYELMEEREVGITCSNDKLFGWPFWVQSVEYPFDRKTKSRMKLLFQIDSNDNLPYTFGDLGIGHLTQSPDNAEELGFGWAC